MSRTGEIHLSVITGHLVVAVKRDPSSVRRVGDALVDGTAAEFKTPAHGATSSTLRNRANEAKRRGGQARMIIFDLRVCGMSGDEAERGIARILGAYGDYFDVVRVVGNSFDIERRP